MPTHLDEAGPPASTTLRKSPGTDPPRTGFVALKGYPELTAVLVRAVDEVIAGSSINRERDAALVEDVERAAAVAALTAYQSLAIAALEAEDAADAARRTRRRCDAATAEVVAERVTGTAAARHDVEEAAADRVALVAANAAAELAASAGVDDEPAGSAAAALVVHAVGEAAAAQTSTRAQTAAQVALAAADAAADLAEKAASSASAAEVAGFPDAENRHQDALHTCYLVAVSTARAMLTHVSACRR
jgi:hypothetical protein